MCIKGHALNFSLSTVSVTSHKFLSILFYYYSLQDLFNLPCDFFPMTYCLFKSMSFNFNIFGDFPQNFVLISSLILVKSEYILYMGSILLSLRCICSIDYNLSLCLFHLFPFLKRMCILLLLARVSYNCQLGKVGRWCGSCLLCLSISY